MPTQASSPGGSTTASREHAQDLGSAAELEGDRSTCSSTATAAPRQRKVYEANHDFTRAHARDRRGLRAVVVNRVEAARSRRRRIDPSMSSGPDLFVVCKSCGSEVSPYITECPYCGTRLRKRAPKLDRGGTPKAPKRAAAGAALPRLRPGEIPGIRADRRPYGTIAARARVGAGHARRARRAWSTRSTSRYGAASTTSPGARSPRCSSTARPATRSSTLGAVALFGWLLERRHGCWAPLLVFLVAGAGGMLMSIAAGDSSSRAGGNGAALGLLAAWAMRDVLGRRHGREDETDLLGVLAIAAVLICMPLVTQEADALAGLAGGVIGVILGLGLARLRER